MNVILKLNPKMTLGLLAFSAFGAFAQETSYPALKFNGDFRYRHEHKEDQGNAASSLEQHRIRARLGATVQADESTQLEFRLATGSGRVSTNQTLGSSFANYSILLDRANAKFTATDWLSVKAGRFANPHYQPGDSDLIWDSDLNFDGVAATGSVGSGSFVPFYTAGFFWVIKDTTATHKDVILATGQIGAQQKLSDDKKLGFEVAYYGYSGLRGHTGLTSNTPTTGGNSASNTAIRQYTLSYKLVEGGADFSLNLLGKSTTFFAQGVWNLEANGDPGYIGGIKWGKLKEKGDWTLAYDYRRIPTDATVAAFTDGDSLGGAGTNGWSHRAMASYQVQKSWYAALSYFYGKTMLESNEQRLKHQLVQADVVVKF